MFKKKPKLDQFNAYGYYNDEHEYVILRPDTPKPWINYLSNAQYHALVSQTGGVYSYYRDSKLHRILNWHDHRKDRPGRYIFLKDQKTGEAWSANWQPLRKPLDYWQAKHSFGTSSIFSEHKGIRTEITYFVPPDDPCEIWLVTLKNKSAEKRTLSVIPYVHGML